MISMSKSSFFPLHTQSNRVSNLGSPSESIWTWVSEDHSANTKVEEYSCLLFFILTLTIVSEEINFYPLNPRRCKAKLYLLIRRHCVRVLTLSVFPVILMISKTYKNIVKPWLCILSGTNSSYRIIQCRTLESQ